MASVQQVLARERSPGFPAKPSRLCKQCVWMVLVALAVRLIVVAFLVPERMNPDRNYWRFAGETGRIARALVQGQGFANPLFGQTGPTAWMTPVYPLLLAAIFKIFGVYTRAAAVVMLSLDSLFSALTCLPVFFLARLGFGDRTANLAGWTWAFFPYAIYFSADFIWPTTLTTLLLGLLMLFLVQMENSRGWRTDLAFGLFAGLAALNDPVVLSVVPFLAAWRYWRRSRGGCSPLVPAAAMALGFVLVVTPWFVRNYQTFQTFVPFRDTLGLELHVGNNGDSSHFAPQGYHPSASSGEFQEYRALGEIAYMERKRQEALAFIRAHPGWFLTVTLRRVFYMWTSFWSFDPAYQAQEPFDLPNIFLSTLVDVLALAGLYRAFRQRSRLAVPCAIVLLFFPLVYYITHWEDYYRRPIDPVFVILAANEIASRFPRREARVLNSAEMAEAAAPAGAISQRA
jgi:4-amino-4-deoxy-L-arabinose transferase-like glycosyltransferase